MCGVDLVQVNASLVKGIRLCIASRALVKRGGDESLALWDIERGMRLAASECQKAIERQTSEDPEKSPS